MQVKKINMKFKNQMWIRCSLCFIHGSHQSLFICHKGMQSSCSLGYLRQGEVALPTQTLGPSDDISPPNQKSTEVCRR